MILEANHASWNAGGKPVLHPTQFRVAKGETVGLVGPNGSGKSTLLHLLAGLRRTNSGHVLLEGKDISSLPRRTIARRIALVEQQAETSDMIRVIDAVELGRTPYLGALGRRSARDRDAVEAALEQVDMAHKRERFWHTLSGGERQRVHIARALAQKPQILLLDEPTNHLDIRHQIGILQLVRDLPVTSVLVLHDLNHAAMFCDRLAVMNEGRILADGPVADILTPSLIRTAFGVDAVIEKADETAPPLIRFTPLAA